MNSVTLKNFEKIYNDTYNNVLRYIAFKCFNVNDINDIIQETYIELYKKLKKNTKISNIESYIIGISKNILKHYYSNIKYTDTLYFDDDNEMEINSEIDLENDIITKNNCDMIWDYLNHKGTIVAKIFYLYYCLDIKLKDISSEMNINESTIKTYMYRTLKELKNKFDKESEINV